MSSIVFATHNLGKLNEARNILTQFDIVDTQKLNIPDVAETGSTYVENALIKAKNACQFTSLPVFADDSGLEIDALDGRPGLYSARYIKANDFDANIAGILEEMKDIPWAKRTARFRSVVVYLRHLKDPAPVIVEATWSGIITEEHHQKTHGFGYDPIFWLTEHQMTASEMHPDTKNKLSHRGQVLKKLAQKLNDVRA
ncbi:MAG: RdgB/HAM1 family non-canonical purine NTP pyrophosphatase [Candidatus Comchoanobacterales bacterium]